MDHKTSGIDIITFAHRGASKDYPENTILSFRKAVELNVDFIETDIHYTKDERFIVMHDERIDRITDGKGKICSYNLGELKQYDAGYNFTIDSGKTFPFRGKGVTIMSLEEMFKEFPEQKFNIDLKDKNNKQIENFIKIIHEYDAHDRVIVASEHYSNLKLLRQLNQDIKTSFSVREALLYYFLFKLGLLFLNINFKGFALQIPENWGQFHVATNAFIRQAHEKNFKVHVWTINCEEDIIRLSNMGVDGIMSDDPALLMSVLNRDSNIK